MGSKHVKNPQIRHFFHFFHFFFFLHLSIQKILKKIEY